LRGRGDDGETVVSGGVEGRWGMPVFRVLLGGALLAAMSGGVPAQASQAEQRQGRDVRRQAPTEEEAKGAVGDAERSAVTFTAYDLAVQLRPAEAGLAVLARVTVRNDGDRPLAEIALEIASTLHWDGVSQRRGDRTEKLPVSQHLLETDADHTGQANEAVFRLLGPLAPKASAELSLLYSGAIGPSAVRWSGLGAAGSETSGSGSAGSGASGSGASSSGASGSGTPGSGTSGSGTPDARSSGAVGGAGPGAGGAVVRSADGPLLADAGWDVIAPEGTLLRGYGGDLWYPTASPQVFVGEGASFAHAAGQQMERQAGASMHLRVSVVFAGEAPAEVFFCGRRGLLRLTNDDENAPVAEATGVATAEFATQELGFRTPSLLVTGKPASSTDGAIAVMASERETVERTAEAAAPVERMLTEWMGAASEHVLTVIDHRGAEFADGGIVVAPIGGRSGAELSSSLVAPLTQARFRSSHVWLEAGVARLMELLWMERTEGRAVAVAAIEQQAHGLALAESATRTGGAEESLLRASDAVYYRTKAAAVLWSLRDLAGDEALKQTLQRYGGNPRLDKDAEGFERLLEEMSGKSYRWLFDDWVYHDRGLPDLSLVSAEAREVSVTGGQRGGWLVAVQVRNDGGAVADVPITVRSGALTATERVRVPAHAVAATRVLFQAKPTQIQVNDGTVPELISSTHLQEIAPAR